MVVLGGGAVSYDGSTAGADLAAAGAERLRELSAFSSPEVTG
jgi:hypothetical protein